MWGKPARKAKKNPAVQSAGCVVLHGGHAGGPWPFVLIREVANHYDDYVWTLPKGQIDPGETPEQAAIRETKEETGYACTIVGLIGDFGASGLTGVTRFFLAKSGGKVGAFDKETQGVEMATPPVVFEKLAMTKKAVGSARDTAAVLSGLMQWKERVAAGTWPG